MPQMSPTLWTILFMLNISIFIMMNMLIYFKWSPFSHYTNLNNKFKNFSFNDKNF